MPSIHHRLPSITFRYVLILALAGLERVPAAWMAGNTILRTEGRAEIRMAGSPAWLKMPAAVRGLRLAAAR